MARIISGMASTDSLDYQGDVVRPSAFRESIAAWRKSDRVIPLLDSHNPFELGSVLGRLSKAEVREHGLFTTFQVAPTPEGDRALELAGGGFVDGLSIGYRILDAEPVRSDSEEASRGIRRIVTKLELREVSVVAFPANPNARITDVERPAKSVTPEDIAELEEEVRKARSAEHLETVARMEQAMRLRAQLEQSRRRQNESRKARLQEITTELRRKKYAALTGRN